MSRAEACVALIAIVAVAACKKDPPPPSEPETPAVPILSSIGPRVIANDSAYPLYLYGTHFTDGMELEIQKNRVPVERVSDTLATALVSGIDLPDDQSLVQVDAMLFGPRGAARGKAPLKVANDADYPWPYDLEVIGGHVFVASPTTDTVWLYAADHAPTPIPVGDRPRALAQWNDGTKTWLVVVHELDSRILLLDADQPTAEPTEIPFRAQSQGIVIDGDVAYVTNRLTDSVHAIDLKTRNPTHAWYAGVDPRAVAVGGGKIAVSNVGGDDMAIIDIASGARTEVVVGPGAEIVGGHTESFSASVMGLKAPRDLHWSPKYQVFIAATLGPNIGPNPKRMEVTQNSGLSVIAPDGTFEHHVSMLRGNAERFVLDEERGVALAADISRGRVVAFDLAAVIAGKNAVVAQLFVEPPDGTAFLRPKQQYGVDRRAHTSSYSGPGAIRFAGGSAWVLNRFTGTVTQVDDSKALGGTLEIQKTWEGPDLGSQKQRRAGEVVFDTDLGDSRMSCDTCHYEGHNQGTLFTKGQPMHIYRVPSLRSISETPPYFTPAKFPSLAKISHFVTARNRFQNLPPNNEEVAALALFQRTLAPPPNPYFAGGKLPDELTLPDGKTGKPAAGASLFAANCATCHPAPMFTPDQDPQTRGKMFETGEVTIGLRPDQQDATPYPVPVPTLVGVWDNHPLFHGGEVGNEVVDGRLVPTRFALRGVLAKPNHFDASGLDDQAQNDLLAYLLTL